MWEVRIGNDLIYVDEKGQYAFVEGSLVDLRSNRNLTRERVDELLTIDFKDLPLNLAIKQVIGNGKRVVAVFEDPNCGYCKKMRMDLVALKDVTIYTFPIPILAADSEVKSRKALCADDKVRAWNDMMISGKVPSNPGTCDTALPKTARTRAEARRQRDTDRVLPERQAPAGLRARRAVRQDARRERGEVLTRAPVGRSDRMLRGASRASACARANPAAFNSRRPAPAATTGPAASSAPHWSRPAGRCPRTGPRGPRP